MSDALPPELAALSEQAHREQDLEKLLELTEKIRDFLNNQQTEQSQPGTHSGSRTPQ